MKDIQQLIKKNSQEGRYEDIFPKTFTDAVFDKESGNTLTEILSGFNMYFLSYNGSRELTRLQVPMFIRKTGLWITYVLYDKTVVTEWYAGEAIDDDSWKSSDNWRVGSNMLVGDISISSDGYWVVNGVVTTTKAQGEQGITPMLRVGSNNHLQVSYTNGSSWVDVSTNPVYTQFRVHDNKLEQSVDLGATWIVVSDELAYQFRNSGNKLQVSKDLGVTWEDTSDYIAAWFRFTGTTGSSQNVGKIQISRDNGTTWSDLSGEFTNSLHIKGYVATVATLPSSAVQGDIYGVGPTYDPSDTEQTNPIYQLYVKDSTGWVNNGKFTSIAAGVVQTTGTSTTEVMSQDAVSKEFASVRSDLSETTDKLFTELELKTDKNSTVSVESNNILQGAIYKDGSFHDGGSGWEYVLFLVAPNDKITFKASGYNTNVISFYALGQTPSVNTYIEGMLCDGNGSSSYKEYNAIAKDFLIAAVSWYRPYGTPSISVERTSLIENFDAIKKDYNENFANTEEIIGKVSGNGGLYSIANKYVNLHGNISNSENVNATDYILIDKSQDIIISNALTGQSSCLIALYDKNKKFISDSAINNVKYLHIEASQIPEDAVYFRSCTRKETLNSVRIYNNIGNSFQKFHELNGSRIDDLIINDRVFSTNEDANVYIKEVYAPSYAKTNNFITIRVAAVSSSSGKYYNGVKLSGQFIFYDSGYETAEDAIAATNQYDGILLYEGNYIIVDFTSVKTSINETFIGDYYDVTKLYNSPKIEEYFHDKEVSNIKEDVSNLKEDVGEIVGLETIEPIVVGIQYGEIISNGKINIATSGTYKISEKINVSKGDIIKIVGSGYNTLMIAEYKAGTEPTPLSFIGGTPCENRVVKEYKYICQENGYVLLCWASVYAKVETYTHIKAGEINALNYKIEASTILNNPNKPLNILIFGDSISDSASIEVSEESLSAVTTSYSLPYNGNSFVVNGEKIRYSMWPALLRRLFNVFDIRCYARYGATYINDSRNTIFRQNLSEQIALALNDLSNPNGVFMTTGIFEPDIVIFALSANDSNTPTDTYEIAMGKTIMSTDGNSFDVDATLANLDLTQFNQAVRYAFLKMKRQFPYALFFIIVPPQRSAYDIGETQKEKDLRRMAERYSIQIIDAAATCGILRDLEINGSVDVYSKDGLHPNNKGQNLYARMVANAIKNNLVDMTLLNE